MSSRMTPRLSTRIQPKVVTTVKTTQRLVSLPLAVLIGSVPTLMLILLKVYG